MFQLNENCEVDVRFLRSEYIKYWPVDIYSENSWSSTIYITIHREISVNSLLSFFFDINFEVIKKAGKSRCANGNDIKMIILGPIVSIQ